MLLATIRNLYGTLRLYAGIDARRPASWIALASGCWTGWWSGASAAVPEATALPGSCMTLLSAAMAAAAAIGDLPLDLCPPEGPGRGRVRLWACERTCWPLAGLLFGSLAVDWTAASLGNVATGFVGVLLAGVTLVAGRLSGATAADAASLTIVIAAASAAAGAAGTARVSVLDCWGAVAIWIVLGGLAWGWSRTLAAAAGTISSPLPDTVARGGGEMLSLDPLPAGGPLRRMLVRASMVAALVAMAGWLVLASAAEGAPAQVDQHGRDEHALQVVRGTVAWALVSAACFIGLAIPQATLLDGLAGVGGWERLLGTAAGAGNPDRGGRHWSRLPSNFRPGPIRFAAGVALTQAAILGWPALLCAVVSLPAPARAWPPLAIVIGLLGAAVLLAAAVAVGGAVRASRETVFAAALAIAAVAASVAMSPSLPSFPALSLPRSLPGFVRSVRRDSVLENWGISCCWNRPVSRNFAGRVEKSSSEER